MTAAYTRTASHDLLQGLVDLGIEYLFCNLGTDHAPLIEEMAHWRAKGEFLRREHAFLNGFFQQIVDTSLPSRSCGF